VTQPEPTVDPDLPPGARQRLFSPVTATLICGHRDAILVDALLTLDQARRLAGWIAAHGKNLTSVYITHAHGDHWFGLSAILDRYPAARTHAAGRARSDAPAQHAGNRRRLLGNAVPRQAARQAHVPPEPLASPSADARPGDQLGRALKLG